MRLLVVFIFILSFLFISCSDDTRPENDKKSCTQDYCDVIAEKCNLETGLCEPWCTTNEECNEDFVCRNQVCELFYISFEDENLESCIKEGINITADQKVSLPQLEYIKKLECPNRNISNLAGIKYLKNLEKLSLWENNITDLSKLILLSKLESLQLGLNNITDITPLTHLGNLKRLSLSFNDIENILTIKDLKKLVWLNLDSNKVSDVTPLLNLNNLIWLTIEHNPIVNPSTLISRIEGNGGRVYFELDTKKGLNRINPIAMSQDGKKIAPKSSKGDFLISLWRKKPIRPEVYERTTSESSYNRLEKYTLESPNQADAGSCLYMANTGAMEIIFNQVTEGEHGHDGDTDISERYLMNADNYARESIEYTMIDVINTFNHHNGALLNKDYPFTVGWVKEDANGNKTASAEGVEDAYFTAEFNWIDGLPNNWSDLLVETPKVARTLLFLDPDLNTNSIWNVGLMNEDIIERIKYELRTKNAPVVVIYNHYLVWHTDIIIGYDDEAGFDKECPMVMDTIETFKEKGATSYVDKIEAQMAKEGGCRTKGIFFVRDSIYDGDLDTDMYYYGWGGSVDGYEDKYSQKVTYHSYDWVKYLANHVYSVHRVK